MAERLGVMVRALFRRGATLKCAQGVFMALWHKRSQEEIFASFGWWEKGCFLGQMTGDRCDYIQACLKRVLGEDALQRHRILEVGCGGGLIGEEMARRGATMVGVDPSQPALETAREHARQSGQADH